MTDQLLLALETKLDQLIQECGRLNSENEALKQEAESAKLRESEWNGERARLVEKNELARTRVEAMITRLKSLEDQT
jgi:cell division protein ZapB